MTAAVLIPFLLLAQETPATITVTAPGKAHVAIARAGYLMVLGATERGNAMIVYPRRPHDDSRVAAGTTIIARARRPFTFVAVWSDQPFDTAGLTANTFWSMDSLKRAGDASLPSALVELARSMSPRGAELVAQSAKNLRPVSLAAREDFRNRTFNPFAIRGSGYAGLSVWPTKYIDASPPAVCHGSVCALPVLAQLGGAYKRW